MYSEALGQKHEGSLAVGSMSVTPCKARLVDSMAFCGVFDLSGSYNPFSPSSVEFKELSLMFGCASTSVSVGCWIKPF